MIDVEGLTHAYGETLAVDDVTVSIGDGEYVVLAGANGSGKTTLVRHFNALLEPDAGTVAVDGIDVTDDPLHARTSVGMVFQEPRDQLVASTVGADVAFGPENLGLDRVAIDRRVRDALGTVNLLDREDERVEELSGGEVARVAIAGALAMAPDHVVLDEPLAGLDTAARTSVLDRLAALADDGTGVVVVSHDLTDLVDDADRIVLMDDGQLVADGAPGAVADDLQAHGVRVPEC